jgi:hypothetical protein
VSLSSPVYPSAQLWLSRLADLLELRKLRRSRQGIESTKLIVGDAKKRRKLEDEYEKTEPGGLRSGAGTPSASEVHAPEGEDVESVSLY